jgi:hypothetical protein
MSDSRIDSSVLMQGGPRRTIQTERESAHLGRVSSAVASFSPLFDVLRFRISPVITFIPSRPSVACSGDLENVANKSTGLRFIAGDEEISRAVPRGLDEKVEISWSCPLVGALLGALLIPNARNVAAPSGAALDTASALCPGDHLAELRVDLWIPTTPDGRGTTPDIKGTLPAASILSRRINTLPTRPPRLVCLTVDPQTPLPPTDALFLARFVVDCVV